MAETKPAGQVEVAEHYLGEKGKEYFRYQGEGAMIGGKINAERFAVHIKPTDTVLDFGCGVGAILENLSAARKIGIEPNPAAREVCAASPSVQALASIGEVADGTVDVAISNHCLEHVPHPVAALREILRVLKAGGKLVVYLPIDDWRRQRVYDAGDINHHLHTWSPLLFGHTLAEAGFVNIHTEVFAHAFPPGYKKLYGSVPRWMFNMLCWAASVAVKRRQVYAVAFKGA